jgi:hypothetical protein
MLKYALARLGLFVAVAIPLVFVAPSVNVLLKLMLAVIISAVLSLFLLRGLRDEVAKQMVTNRDRKVAEKERLRAALAGEDEPTATGTGPAASPADAEAPKPGPIDR